MRVGISGPGQISLAEEQHGRHAKGTRDYDLLGSSGTPPTKPNLLRGPILQAGEDVPSGHQENHTEHRVQRNGCSFSQHSVSASTDEHNPQPWNESDRRFWKIC